MDEKMEEFGGESGLSPEIKLSTENSPEKLSSTEQIFEQTTEKKGEKMDELLARIDTHTSTLKAATANQVKDDAHVLSQIDEEERITKLLNLADAKGVIHAVSVARTLEDFYALDMFRDTLIEKLHEKLDQVIIK